jgi:hypothetical protein
MLIWGYPQPNSGTQRMAIQGPPTEQDSRKSKCFASWIRQARHSTLTSGLASSEELKKLLLTMSLATRSPSKHGSRTAAAANQSSL